MKGSCELPNLNLYLILCSFSELNLNGLKLSKPVVDRLCQLAKTSCLTHLMLGCTNLGSVSEPLVILLLLFPLEFKMHS